MSEKFKLFSGTANIPLAEETAKHLKTKLGKITITNFADGEIFVQILESVRGEDVFVLQPTCNPGNQNLMELLLIIDALKRASAKRITAVIPYYGYARQDRKDKPRVALSAKLVANLITSSGVDRILGMDLHCDQIQGFFDIPLDHLYAAPIFIEYLKNSDLTNTVIVAPDPGAVDRARFLARHLNTSIAIIDKRRPDKNIAQVMNIVGEVENKNLIIVDDMVDTAGTLTESVLALKNKGARSISACCTHAVLSGVAYEKITNSPLEKVITTNTIPLQKKIDKIVVLSVANLLAEAIQRIHDESSVSSLFIRSI